MLAVRRGLLKHKDIQGYHLTNNHLTDETARTELLLLLLLQPTYSCPNVNRSMKVELDTSQLLFSLQVCYHISCYLYLMIEF